MPRADRRRAGSSLTGEEARQGWIVLSTRRRRVVFVVGLAALALLPVIVALLR